MGGPASQSTAILSTAPPQSWQNGGVSVHPPARSTRTGAEMLTRVRSQRQPDGGQQSSEPPTSTARAIDAKPDRSARARASASRSAHSVLSQSERRRASIVWSTEFNGNRRAFHKQRCSNGMPAQTVSASSPAAARLSSIGRPSQVADESGAFGSSAVPYVRRTNPAVPSGS